MITVCIDEKDPTLLGVYFPEDTTGNDLIGQVPERRFSCSRKGWVVPNTRESVVKIGQLFGKDHCRFDEAIVGTTNPLLHPPNWNRPRIQSGPRLDCHRNKRARSPEAISIFATRARV